MESKCVKREREIETMELHKNAFIHYTGIANNGEFSQLNELNAVKLYNFDCYKPMIGIVFLIVFVCSFFFLVSFTEISLMV